MDVHRYLLDMARFFSNFNHSTANEYPNEYRQEIGDLAAEWVKLLQQDQPSVADVESLVSRIGALVEMRAEGAKKMHVIAASWLNELKGGKGYDPVEEFAHLWENLADGNSALFDVGGGYSIVQISKEGTPMTLTIEDDLLAEAVDQKMIEKGVPILHSTEEYLAFVARWHERHNKP
jgi:hypothetical protein